MVESLDCLLRLFISISRYVEIGFHPAGMFRHVLTMQLKPLNGMGRYVEAGWQFVESLDVTL